MSRVAVAWAAALFATRALAQGEVETAETYLRRGVELRREGRDAEALDAFARAYALQRSPRTAAQWGLACQANGRWVQAEALLREALAAPTDPWVARNRAALDRAVDVAGRHLATVELVGGVDGARARINGDDAGTFPLPGPRRVLAGTVVVELQADGYEPLTLRFITQPGEVLRERATLVLRPPPPDPPTVPDAPPQPPPQPDAVALRPAARLPETPHRAARAGAIAAFAGAGVFAVAGVTALVLRSDAVDGYNASCDPGDARGACGDLRDRGLWATGAAVVALPTVALLAGAGVALWFGSRPARRSEALACAPSIVGMHCGWRF